MKLNVLLIMLIAILGIGIPAITLTLCNHKDNEHQDKSVARCWYTQKDLSRIYANNADRYKKMGVDGTVCFYCGCNVNEHTEK